MWHASPIKLIIKVIRYYNSANTFKDFLAKSISAQLSFNTGGVTDLIPAENMSPAQ